MAGMGRRRTDRRHQCGLQHLASAATSTQRLEAAIIKVPNIVECEAVLGDIDYILTIVAASISHYQEIIGSLLTAFPDEIDYTTYPASKLLKRENELSLLKLSSEEAT